ncbi:MAG TPA: exo-beta-N-acetylmuramidase NamZ domain-containing protein [Thermoanaerobaculia bacterium]|nr:exo-beta-N-acetylmuramidase NamZ domain-containing protein [Thermoanaerobaculia bacterium]
MFSSKLSSKRRSFDRRFAFCAALLFVASCATVPPVAEVFDPAKLREIDATIERAIDDGRIPGGVLWIERNGAVYGKTYGNRAVEPQVEALTPDTIYDAASITKVVATAPSIWLLVQQGKVELDAPVSSYIPEIASKEITVRHLLTHTSGLKSGLSLSQPWRGYDEGIRRAAAEVPTNKPGAIFRYSDVNYILLGEIVRRVSGQPLDEFSREHIFKPLGMRDTLFKPRNTIRVAPTERADGEGILRAVVHDPTSRRMGGVAGHAGLFTTIDDLAKFARALLEGGGKVFTPETVRAMTSVQSPPGVAIRRAGGFDLESVYARPRGNFPLGSYGHTGWTGGFMWIDPYSETFYVFLSNRVHPDGRGNVVPLQRELGRLVSEAVRGVDYGSFTNAMAVRNGGGVRYAVGGGDAQNGIDVLAARNYEQLRGLKIGLITNHTGIDKAGNPTIDLLRSAPGVELVALFSPEHGIRGQADENIGDDRDEFTGLPIYSLYGERRKPSAAQLENLDALVFDIQDIGARFYTYISTLGLAMESAAEAKKKFFVLDRVNPIGGTILEGPVRDGAESFVAWHPINLRHGMTVGELAKMFRDERKIDVDLTVIEIRNWKRDQWQDEAGLPWINTSPNMRSLMAAGLYPGLGLVESALSVGRGTSLPFEQIGAPYIDAEALERDLLALRLPGVTFEPVTFTPDYSVHKGEVCHGLRFTITDRRALRAVDLGIALATILYRRYPTQFDPGKMTRLLVHPATMDAIKAGRSLEEIKAMWASDFEERRKKYLIY